MHVSRPVSQDRKRSVFIADLLISFLKYDNIYNPANGHKIYIDNGIFSRIVDRINNISIVTCIEYPESKWTYNEDEWEKYYKTEKELITNNCKWR